MKMIHNHFYFWVVALLSPVIVNANDITLSLPIDAVVVHPRSALVTRQAQASIPAGEHRLIIADLPPNIDPARLQLSVASNNVRLGSLELEEAHQGDLIAQQERQLRDELQTLKDDRTVVSDRTKTANLQLQLLNSLATGGDSTSVKPTVNGNELAALLNTLSSNSNSAREQIRQANIQLRDIDRDIERKEFELSQITTRRKTATQLVVNIRAEQAVTAPVTVTYPEQNAWWEWLYEARLSTDTSRLSYLRQVSVRQGTGEDWSNVELTITTADNRRNTRTPELPPLFVDVSKPQEEIAVTAQRRDFSAAQSIAPEPVQPFASVGALADSMVRDEASVIASQYLVEYEIPGRVTVLANRQAKVLPIDEKDFDVELVTRSVPERSTMAFLEARFTYNDDIPLQIGEVQLYRDNAFIGEGVSPTLLPGKDVSLPFGNDERVRVEVHDETEGSKEGGAFSRSDIQQNRKRFEVTSYHAKPIQVEVLARVPVSRNSRVEVEIPDAATPAVETEVDGKAGLLLWSFPAQPQQTRAIKHYFNITYPKDSELDFQERRNY